MFSVLTLFFFAELLLVKLDRYFYVSVQNSPIQNSPIQNSPKKHSKVQKTVPYKTVPKIVRKIVQKTVPLIEVIIVLEADK